MAKKEFTPVRLDVDAFAKANSLQKARGFVKYVQAISDSYNGLGQGPITNEVFNKLLIDPMLVKTAFLDGVMQGKSVFEQKMAAHFANELFGDVLKAVSEFRNQISAATVQSSYELKVEPDFFGFDVEGKAFLKPDVEQVLEDYFSFNLENQEEAKLFELAENVVHAIENLKSHMVENHFYLDVDLDLVGRNGFIYEREANTFAIDHKVLPSWRLLRARNISNLKTA